MQLNILLSYYVNMLNNAINDDLVIEKKYNAPKRFNDKYAVVTCVHFDLSNEMIYTN